MKINREKCLFTIIGQMFGSPKYIVCPHHSVAVDSKVDLPLYGPLLDVFGCHAAVDLQSVKEHLAVQPVACPLQP